MLNSESRHSPENDVHMRFYEPISTKNTGGGDLISTDVSTDGDEEKNFHKSTRYLKKNQTDESSHHTKKMCFFTSGTSAANQNISHKKKLGFFSSTLRLFKGSNKNLNGRLLYVRSRYL